MSRRSTAAGSLGGAALIAALLTACGATPSTDTNSALTRAAATSRATDAVASTPTSIIVEPSSKPTTQPPPTMKPATTATITALDHSQHAPDARAEMSLEIKLFMFKSATLDVQPGTTLTWTNQDTIEHSVTAGTPESPSGVFDSALFGPGQTFRFTFNQPGTYPYFCQRHESMRGTITVTAP